MESENKIYMFDVILTLAKLNPLATEIHITKSAYEKLVDEFCPKETNTTLDPEDRDLVAICVDQDRQLKIVVVEGDGDGVLFVTPITE